MQDNHWIEFLQGDNQALSKVYEPYFHPLLFVALKYVRNTEVAQDITGELFTSLLETSPEMRQEKWSQIRDVKAFLTTIVKCRALDHLKIQQNRNRLLANNLDVHSQVYESNNDEIHHLSKCIDSLPIDEQALINLHLAGYKNQEIAENLNYSEKTVRNKLSASRKKLIYLWKNLIVLLLWQL